MRSVVGRVRNATFGLSLLVALPGLAVSEEVPCSEGLVTVYALERDSRKPVKGVQVSIVASSVSEGVASSPVIQSTNKKGFACIAPVGDLFSLRLVHPKYREVEISQKLGKDKTNLTRTIFLAPAFEVQFVVSHKGTPLKDAQLAWKIGSEKVVEGVTDPAGKSPVISGYLGDSVRFGAYSSGFAADCRVVRDLQPGTNVRKVALAKTASGKVSLKNRSDEPVGEAEFSWLSNNSAVECEEYFPDLDWPRPEFVREKAKGTWSIQLLPPGLGELEYSSRGYRPGRIGPLEILPGERRDFGTLYLDLSKQITGRVLDMGERAVEGATVSAREPLGKRSASENITDEDGWFQLDGLNNGVYELIATKGPGRRTKASSVRAGRRNLILMLPDAGELSGSVLSWNGDPVGGAIVSVKGIGAGGGKKVKKRSSVTTDKEGRFVFEDLEPGTWRIDVSAPGFAPGREGPIQIMEGEPTEIELILREGFELQGKVVLAESGEPVLGATVWCGSSMEAASLAVSDENGNFSIANLPPGIVELFAHHPALGEGSVRTDSREKTVKIVLNAFGNVEGFVTGSGGLPVGGKTVEVQGGEIRTQTEADGFYFLGNVPAGYQRINLWRENFGDYRAVESQTVTIQANETVRVDFSGGVSVSGRVLRMEQPVDNAVVAFTRMKEGRPSGNFEDVFNTRTDNSGAYEILDLPPGTYTGRVQGVDFAVHRVAEIIENWPNVVDFLIVGNVLEGVVIDAENDEPIAQAVVEVYNPSNSFRVSRSSLETSESRIESSQVMGGGVQVSVSDSDGQFTFVLPAGGFEVTASRRGFQRAQQRVSVAEGYNLPLRIPLVSSHDLYGVLRDMWGGGVARGTVSVLCGPPVETEHGTVMGSGRHSRTDEDGFFEFLDVPQLPCVGLAYLIDLRLVGILEDAGGAVGNAGVKEIVLHPAGGLRIGIAKESSSADWPGVIGEGGYRIDAVLRSCGSSGMRPSISEVGEISVMEFPMVPVGRYKVFYPAEDKEITIQINEGEIVEIGLTGKAEGG